MHYVVRLSCFHVRVWTRDVAPTVGDMVTCHTCRDERAVATTHAEFRFKCNSCRSARRTGAAKLQAERLATQHQWKHPTHTVTVCSGSDVLYIWFPKNRSNCLPFGVDEPPF